MIINNPKETNKNKQINKTSTVEQNTNWEVNIYLAGQNVSTPYLNRTFITTLKRASQFSLFEPGQSNPRARKWSLNNINMHKNSGRLENFCKKKVASNKPQTDGW